jgi:hypothetical protein
MTRFAEMFWLPREKAESRSVYMFERRVRPRKGEKNKANREWREAKRNADKYPFECLR